MGIEREFGGEVRKFDLSPIGAWRGLEERCNAGIGKIMGRVWSTMATKVIAAEGGYLEVPNPEGFEFFGDDIREVLFQGLKGGGMEDMAASKLMRQVYDSAPGKAQFAPLAAEILRDWWFGVPKGNAPAPEKNSEATAPAASTSAASMEQVQS